METYRKIKRRPMKMFSIADLSVISPFPEQHTPLAMADLDWQTVAAVASAAVAVLAAWISYYTVRKTLWLSALTALEQRFSQINHAKIADPTAWDAILSEKNLTGAAKHLIFETFQFYHQAFLLHQRKAIADDDYRCWELRLKDDLLRYPSYRKWWNEDQSIYHTSWDAAFISTVASLITQDARNSIGLLRHPIRNDGTAAAPATDTRSSPPPSTHSPSGPSNQ
jgi:hypothetical protein